MANTFHANFRLANICEIGVFYLCDFSYGVSDPHTSDNKHAEETLVNGVVHGSYSLTEPDGTIRKGNFTRTASNKMHNRYFNKKKISSHHTPIIVTYTADKINGFNAVVEKAGVAHHAAPVAKVAHAPYIAHSPYVAHAPTVVAPAYHGYGLLH